MSTPFRALVVVAIAWGIVAVVWSSPASAASSLTVTPHADLVDGQRVTIHGSGWPANTDIGFCEGVPDSTPSPGDCVGSANIVTSDGSGSFTVSYPVSRRGFSSDHGAVDCAVQQCAIAAAVFSDIANTIKTVDVSFNPAQVDARIVQRSSGVISGDDVYAPTLQSVRRSFAPATSYAFALQVQNDGPATDDAIVTASVEPIATHITARYFLGYYDVTSLVTGSGLRIRNLGPGQIKALGVKVSVAAAAVNGERSTFTVSFASGAAGSGGGDAAQIQATVRTP